MTTENALLDRALSDADPARTPRDAAPDARAIATRDRILHSTAAPKRRRRARALGWATGLVAVATASVVAVAMLTPQGAAVAGTPDPLSFTGTSTVADIVQGAQRHLAASSGLTSPERRAQTASWSYTAGDEVEGAKIVPQLSTFVWNEDLSGHVKIVNGVPYDPADAVANSSAEVVSSGEVVDEFDLAPGEFTTPVPDPPGESAAEVEQMLEAFDMPKDPTAFDVVTALTSAFGTWTLTNTQHAQILRILENTGDADALGETTDRLGRPVAGLRVLSADGVVSDVLLVSTETGRIVGVERTQLIDDGYAPAGAVTGYRMWDVDERTLG